MKRRTLLIACGLAGACARGGYWEQGPEVTAEIKQVLASGPA